MSVRGPWGNDPNCTTCKRIHEPDYYGIGRADVLEREREKGERVREREGVTESDKRERERETET